MNFKTKKIAYLLIVALVANIVAPAVVYAAPDAPALGLLGVQPAGIGAPAAAQPKDGVVPAQPAQPANAPGWLSRAGSWLKEFGSGVVDGFVHAVPNLIQSFKDSPIKTTLMVGGMVALGVLWPPGALLVGGALIAKGIYDSGGDARKLGQLTGETAFWAGTGAIGARAVRGLRGQKPPAGGPKPTTPVTETPVTKPITEAPVTTPRAPVTETPVTTPRAPVTETPVPTRTGTSVVEPTPAPTRTGTGTGTSTSTVTEPTPTPTRTGNRTGTTETPPPTTPPNPALPKKYPGKAPEADVIAHDVLQQTGRDVATGGHWKNPPQACELPGAPGSRRYIADSNVFQDLPGQPGARARMDGIIDNPANELVVPRSAQAEFLPSSVDKNGTQAARWGQTGARRTPIPDPPGLAELAVKPMIDGKFGAADLALVETALQQGLTIITRNYKMIEQIRGASAPKVRFERYKNVKIEYIGD